MKEEIEYIKQCVNSEDFCGMLMTKDKIELLLNEIERLNNIIEKAVEYIRQYDGHIEGYYYSKEHKRFLVEENVKDDLLNILKGEERY